MSSNLSAAQRAELEQRNAEHEPVYWMALSLHDAEELALCRVTDKVQQMALWLCEPLEDMLARTAAKRPEPTTRRGGARR